MSVMPATVAFYVSAHGYGHASRQAALIAELRRRHPALRILVRSQAPAWLLAPNKEAACKAVSIDPPIAQPDSFHIDLAATRRRFERFISEWDARAEREAAFLEKERVSAVLSDIAALPFEAAARAGVPAFGIGNFSWDVLLSGLRQDEVFGPAVDAYRKAYGRAREFFRLPMHMEMTAFPKVTDCPLLVRRSALSREEARRALGLPPAGRPVVLLSFGGMGHDRLNFSDGDDLSGFVFTGFGPAPAGLKAQWVPLTQRSASAPLDAMAACDAALAKPGYGVLSEALSQGKPAALVPLRLSPESPVLIEAFRRSGFASLLDEEDLRRGRWRRALEAALAAPPRPPAPCEGAAFLASRLATLLE